MFDFASVLTPDGLSALGQVIMIDLMLAGDNVVVLGALAAGLPPKDLKRVLALGVGLGIVFRILFALLATQLLQVTGLLLAGGLLLVWVAWKLWRELNPAGSAVQIDDPDTAAVEGPPATKTFMQAVIQVTLVDLSMSLDNVLAVAGAAHEHPTVLIFGLLLSVAVMGVAANYVATVIKRYPWLAYIGLAVILYVAATMIWTGYHDVARVADLPRLSATAGTVR